MVSKQNVIAKQNISFQRTPIQKAIGLMFSTRKNEFAMIFSFPKKRRIAITMWFVFYPIDIIFLDETNMVVELKDNLKPFRNYYSKQQAKTFIEVPKGTIQRFNLKKGIMLHYIPSKVSILSHNTA
ncbi:MAG: DUF192 domain-containing protein [Nanobdellota archaeon]